MGLLIPSNSLMCTPKQVPPVHPTPFAMIWASGRATAVLTELAHTAHAAPSAWPSRHAPSMPKATPPCAAPPAQTGGTLAAAPGQCSAHVRTASD
jgi:hypothetical protein